MLPGIPDEEKPKPLNHNVTYTSVVSVVLTLRASAIAAAPSLPTLLSPRLQKTKNETSTIYCVSQVEQPRCPLITRNERSASKVILERRERGVNLESLCDSLAATIAD